MYPSSGSSLEPGIQSERLQIKHTKINWIWLSSFSELNGPGVITCEFLFGTSWNIHYFNCCWFERLNLPQGKEPLCNDPLVASVCLTVCPDSLESRGKQTLHQCEILRYNFGFNLDPLCGWQQLETLDDVLNYHFSIKFVSHSNLPTHCHKVVAKVNSSLGRVFDFL